MLAALVGLVVVCVVGVVVLALVFALFAVALGMVFGLLALAVKLLPFVLLAWLVVKVIQSMDRPRGLSAADRRWLDTRI
jgi:biotin transporter BioY